MRNQTLFSLSADDVVVRASKQARITEFKPGESICYQGDPRSPLMLVLAGQVRLAVFTEDGFEIPIRVIKSGQSLGEAPILNGLPIPGNVVAVRKSTVALINRADARQLFDEPAVSRALNRSLAFQLRQFVVGQATQGLPRADARISAVVLSAIENTTKDESPLIELPKHATVAAMAKVSRETVSRVLKSLEDRGVIAKEGGLTRVRDRIALQNLVAGCSTAREGNRTLKKAPARGAGAKDLALPRACQN